MNDYLLAALLGVVEGLTEFLPVSSTAHLRIVEGLMNVQPEDPYWKMFSIVIQLGAILALPVYFWREILRFITTFPRGERGDRTIFTHPLSLTAIAFATTAIPAYLLKKTILQNLESFTVMGVALIVGGVVMWIVDVLCRNPRIHRVDEMNVGHAIWIGAVQILSAVFPGTSRSMSTIAGAQLAGLSRAAALEFSFFVSMPTMAAATLNELKDFLEPKTGEAGLAQVGMDAHHWTMLIIGMVVSFIVALAVIAWFMAWVRNRGFIPFAIYRIVAGIAVLLWFRHW